MRAILRHPKLSLFFHQVGIKKMPTMQQWWIETRQQQVHNNQENPAVPQQHQRGILHNTGQSVTGRHVAQEVEQVGWYP